MLEANTSAIRNGTGLIASRSHTSSVTGAISNTVVTLSSSAEATAVTKHQQDHDPQRGTVDALGRPDRDVFEDAGLPEHADDDHHPQQQKDDVPVDSGLAGVEDILGSTTPSATTTAAPLRAARVLLTRSLAIST